MFTFTDMAIDYSVDELDDLTDRKVAPEGIDGDRLARIIRARRNVSRAMRMTADSDSDTTNDNADFSLWNGSMRSLWADGNRRMAAVGRGGSDGMGPYFWADYVDPDDSEAVSSELIS
jgi:hypothetical protein